MRISDVLNISNSLSYDEMAEAGYASFFWNDTCDFIHRPSSTEDVWLWIAKPPGEN